MIRLATLTFCLLFACTAHAAVRVNDLSPGNTVTFTNWAGTGDRTVDLSFCAVSVVGAAPSSNTTTPYQIQIRPSGGGRGGGNAPLQLEASSGSGEILPLRVVYTDIITSNSEQLQTNTYTAQDKAGALNNCPTGLNARLRFTINQSDLALVSAGTYQARLRILIRGGNNGTQIARRNIGINITLDDIVNIQGLDDILLGNYSGAGDISASEAFCITRNGSGTYQVTASGSGPGSSFVLSNNNDHLNFTAQWDDGSTVTPLTANTSLTARQNAHIGTNLCGTTSPNVNLLISITEADLNNAPSGNYRGTLVLIIAPE